MRKTLSVLMLVVLCLLLAACEPFWEKEKDKEGLSKPCAPAPAKMTNARPLPASFPVPGQMTLVSVQKEGPTTVASGWIAKKIGPAHQAFSGALRGASGWSITKEEQDAADSEVNFNGKGKSGQVKMVQECKDRTTVTITIRPA